jgi:hypothetical protein
MVSNTRYSLCLTGDFVTQSASSHSCWQCVSDFEEKPVSDWRSPDHI